MTVLPGTPFPVPIPGLWVGGGSGLGVPAGTSKTVILFSAGAGSWADGQITITGANYPDPDPTNNAVSYRLTALRLGSSSLHAPLPACLSPDGVVEFRGMVPREHRG